METEAGGQHWPLTGLRNSREHDLPYLGRIRRSLLTYLASMLWFVRCSYRVYSARRQGIELSGVPRK